jgi:hypothetical protein
VALDRWCDIAFGRAAADAARLEFRQLDDLQGGRDIPLQGTGRDYSSERITLADISSGAGRAQSIVSRYPDGAPVTVYHNPADPSDAVLERGGTAGIQILYVIGGVFAAAGVLFLFGSVTGRVHTGP